MKLIKGLGFRLQAKAAAGLFTTVLFQAREYRIRAHMRTVPQEFMLTRY